MKLPQVRLEARAANRPGRPLLVLLGSVLAGLVAVGILFAASGANPLYAIYRIFSGSFGSPYGLGETLTKAIPLIMIGAGLTIAFRARFWNIGAEGQLLMGATAATWIGLHVSLPGPALLLMIFLGAGLAGAVWGLIPAVLRVRLGVNEVISTLMLNYLAAQTITALVTGPWKGASQQGFPYTDNLPSSAELGTIGATRIHVLTLVLAVVCAVVLSLLVRRSRFGYELRVIGENPDAARYAGIDYLKVTVIIMAISGGMAGLAGAGEIAGIHHHLTYPSAISGGYGFTAIIVAWLAKLNPLAAVVSGVFFAGILVGGDAIQISLGLPAATVQVFNGTLLVCLIAGDTFVQNRLKVVWPGRTPAVASAGTNQESR